MRLSKPAIWILLHFTVVASIYALLYLSNYFHDLPNNINLMRYDSIWYLSIKDLGYVFVPEKGCNLAFFPLFPIIWRLLAVSPVWISSINLIIFLCSCTFLFKKLEIEFKKALFILAIPSFIFFAVPYSESLFFLFTSLILIGYNTNSTKIKIIGLFGASLVRSVCLLFIPTIIICEVLFVSDSQIPLTKKITNALISIAACLCGLLITVGIQYYQTGKLFYFLTVQQYWKRRWVIPNIPLTTTAPKRMLAIDSIAFTLGAIALILLIIWLYRYFKKDDTFFNNVVKIDKAVIFSAVYLSGIMFMDTFFTINTKNGGNLWSINRHSISTPFFVVFILWLTNNHTPFKRSYLWLFISVVFACLFLTGTFQYPGMIFFYISFFLAVVIFRYFPKYSYLFYFVYIIEIYHQVLFYNHFLIGKWLG